MRASNPSPRSMPQEVIAPPMARAQEPMRPQEPIRGPPPPMMRPMGPPPDPF